MRDSDWLWSDTDVLARRRDKAAAVIAAVSQVLESELPDDVHARAYVAAFHQFQTFSNATRDRLAADPYTYYWGRLAYELLQLTQNPERTPFGLAGYYCQQTGVEAGEALRRHLHRFSKLLVAAACLDGTDMTLAHQLTVQTPFAVPGTAMSYDTQGEIVIAGVSGGKIDAVHGSRKRERVQASQYPVVEFHGCEIRLQPAVFNIIASGIPLGASELNLDSQTRVTPRLVHALTLLRQIDAGGFNQVREGIRVVALRPAGKPGELINISHCDLPGAILIHPFPSPYELCNILLHEYLHTRLFALEEQGLFLDSRTDDGPPESFYSPWREDQRPAHGLLHAAYVFTGIGRYWLNVVHTETTPEPIRELAKSRVLRGLYQVRISLAQLRCHQRFAEAGHIVLDLLEKTHHQLWVEAKNTGIGSDLPLLAFVENDPEFAETLDDTVQAVVKRHLHRFAGPDHANDLGRLIATPI